MSGVPSLPAEIGRTDIQILPSVDLDNKLDDVAIDNFRPYKVIVIGAGFSGINCAIRIPERLRNVELIVYEKNGDVGGTWLENRYPGCACDVPAHSYQYSYAPNPNWSAFYAPAKEIHDYLKDVCQRFSASRFIKLNHRVDSCRWDAPTSKWHVKITDVASTTSFEDVADSVICARGSLNDIQWPEIEGLHSFRGKILHSAAWDTNFDFSNKTLGIIGAGSSAIQIVPQLQKLPGTQLKCFVRSKTWISQPFGASISDEQKSVFASDAVQYHKFRKQVEQDGNSVHFLTIRNTEMQHQAREHFQAEMRRRLSRKPEIADAIIPDFAVGCRRLTPGQGYLEALQEPNVEFINQKIQRVVPEGIVLEDGAVVKLDILVCATGFRAAKSPPFPIFGLKNVDMATRFDPYPETYLSILMDGFPNFFSILGPNSLIGTGSLTMMLESEADYIIKCIRKMQRENISSMDVKKERFREFSDYIGEYFKHTVYLSSCSSWYRNEGGRGPRVIGLWPGSALHALEAFRAPRWEDFNYEYEKDENGKAKSQLAWLGSGWTDAQNGGPGDLAFYLEPEYLNVPAEPLPENTRRYLLRSYCG